MSHKNRDPDSIEMRRYEAEYNALMEPIVEQRMKLESTSQVTFSFVDGILHRNYRRSQEQLELIANYDKAQEQIEEYCKNKLVQGDYQY
jgi:hypothetical protein